MTLSYINSRLQPNSIFIIDAGKLKRPKMNPWWAYLANVKTTELVVVRKNNCWSLEREMRPLRKSRIFQNHFLCFSIWRGVMHWCNNVVNCAPVNCSYSNLKKKVKNKYKQNTGIQQIQHYEMCEIGHNYRDSSPTWFTISLASDVTFKSIWQVLVPLGSSHLLAQGTWALTLLF